MDKAMQPIHMAKHVFWTECMDKRAIMGFVLGMALFGYWMHFFLRFVWDMGEPMNILEPFIVVEHHNKNMLFLSLGWLLVIADAPFIKGNTYLALYRGSRKRWCLGMLLYIAIQSFLYVAWIAAASVFVGSFWGFFGDIWSSPAYQLAMDNSNQLGVAYNITFHWRNIMENMTAPQAFAVTFLFLWMYLMVLGFLLYACSLLWKETYSILAVFGLQLSGYLLEQDGFAHLSLLAMAMPGHSIDGAGSQWKTALLFFGILLFLAVASLWAVGRVDFQNREEGA